VTAFEVREGTMIAMDAGEHVIVLSGYGPLISVDRLSQSGDELEPKWLRICPCTYVYIYIYICLSLSLSLYIYMSLVSVFVAPNRPPRYGVRNGLPQLVKCIAMHAHA
jgi:hypothetical protein